MVRLDLGPLIQRQTRIATPKVLITGFIIGSSLFLFL